MTISTKPRQEIQEPPELICDDKEKEKGNEYRKWEKSLKTSWEVGMGINRHSHRAHCPNGCWLDHWILHWTPRPLPVQVRSGRSLKNRCQQIIRVVNGKVWLTLKCLLDVNSLISTSLEVGNIALWLAKGHSSFRGDHALVLFHIDLVTDDNLYRQLVLGGISSGKETKDV